MLWALLALLWGQLVTVSPPGPPLQVRDALNLFRGWVPVLAKATTGCYINQLSLVGLLYIGVLYITTEIHM